MKKKIKNRISRFAKVKNSTFEGANSVSKFAMVVSSDIGYASYISSYSKIFNCKIGRYCSVGQKVQIVFGNHPTKNFVSTHPVFYACTTQIAISYVTENKFAEYSYADNANKYYVEIGNDVWIGYQALIMSGLHIGDGAIIASGAVVTKDVPPYSIVGGVPAKVMRYRFEPEIIEFLLNLKWWNKDRDWIEEHSQDFDNVEHLKERMTNE